MKFKNIKAVESWVDELEGYQPSGWTDEIEGFERLSESEVQYMLESGSASDEFLAAVSAREAIRNKALRNSWSTSKAVLELATKLLGRPIDSDPFFNPYGEILGFLDKEKPLYLATGRDLSDSEDDGFKCELGETQYYNGPFSHVAPWAERAAVNGSKGARVALVAPCSPGLGWFRNYVWTADYIVFCGREKFIPAPGVAPSSPSGSTILAVWNSECDLPGRSGMIKASGFKNKLPFVQGVKEFDAVKFL